jgi:two-component sensor histidine kinase
MAEAESESGPLIDSRDAAVEANHRIANNLTIIAGLVRAELLSINPQTVSDYRSVRRSLQNLSLRIDAIGRLHRLLTNSTQEDNVEICAYLHEIADAGKTSLADADDLKILLALDTRALLSAKAAVAVGAIVSEALANAIKHSHPPGEAGVICISCKREKCSSLVIEIKDDGLGGLQGTGGERAKENGVGKDLMRTLASSLGASLEIIQGDSGHIVRLELPLSGQKSGH